MTSEVQEFSGAIAAAAESVGPAVVGLGRGWGLGSGVVIAEGRVLTSAHNLRRDEPTVVFADDRREAASVLAADRDLDLAVLELDTGDAPVVDRAALGTVLARLGRLLADHPGLAEIEINPLRATAGGLLALDAVVRKDNRDGHADR